MLTLVLPPVTQDDRRPGGAKRRYVGAMTLASMRFLSVDTVCRRVGSIAEVPGQANSLYRPPHDPVAPPREPAFFDPADAAAARKLASTERNRDVFGLGFDDSHDHFFARLDDVVVERRSVYDAEVYRIFIDRGIALSEPYNSHYKAEWSVFRGGDSITLNAGGATFPVYLHHEIEPEAVIEEPVILLADRRVDNYYHWMCEVLPRLWITEALPELARATMLVNDSPLSSFQKQTLGAIAGDAPLLRFPWRSARFKRLYVPSFIAAGETGRRLRPWYAHLRSRLGGEIQPGSPKRIYVSRAGATHRRVINNAEIAQALGAIGFTSVVLERMSVASQLALFAGAEAVVMPHGAAGANLAAAAPGTLVVECHAASLLNPTYWQLANALDLPYGIAVSGDLTEGKPDFAADISVDPAKLRRVVEAGLAATKPGRN